MNTLTLTKKLISIPSYVDKNSSEIAIGKFLFDYLKTFPGIKIIKQPVKDGRFNLILKDEYPTKFLVCGHLDTVQTRTGWLTQQLKPILKNGRLYGLGATDMKGNIAAFLSALKTFRSTKGLMILLYVDEEYDFLGMKTFIKEYANIIKPKHILSLDGRNLAIGNSCRGLIELNITVKGKTGHASMPQKGNNAILKTTKVINAFTSLLKQKETNSIGGKTTCNLAYLEGGLELFSIRKFKNNIGKEGNNIADIAEFVVDIRPATQVCATKIITILTELFKKEKIKVKKYSIRHDLRPWITQKKELQKVESIIRKYIKVTYINPNTYGYIDTQMLWETFNNVPCFSFGAGEAKLAHKPNEYISIKKLKKFEEISKELLTTFAKGSDIYGI